MLALSSAVSVATPARQRERPWCRGFDLREEKVAMLVLRGIRPDTAPDGLGRMRCRRGAAVALAAATVLVLTSCSSSPVAESTVKATQAAVATPESDPTNPADTILPGGEGANTTERAQLISSLEIPTGLSTDELGATLVQRIETWTNFGAKESTIQAWKDADNKSVDAGGPGVQLNDFMKSYAKDHASEFGEALFVDPNNAIIGVASQSNSNVLVAWADTQNNQSNGAQEGYKATCTTDSVKEISSSGSDITLSIDYTASDNLSKMGGLLEVRGNGPVNTVIVLREINGHEKIVSWDTNNL